MSLQCKIDDVVWLKARAVDRGDKKRPGTKFKETFSHVARMATFRMFIAMCILQNVAIYQSCINSANFAFSGRNRGLPLQ